jgi:hypothetical protein
VAYYRMILPSLGVQQTMVCRSVTAIPPHAACFGSSSSATEPPVADLHRTLLGHLEGRVVAVAPFMHLGLEPAASLCQLYAMLGATPPPPPAAVVLALVACGWTQVTLENLSVAIALPFREILLFVVFTFVFLKTYYFLSSSGHAAPRHRSTGRPMHMNSRVGETLLK